MDFFQDMGEENYVVFHKNLPARDAVYDNLSPHLHWRIEEILKKGNLAGLYSHQAEAISEARKKKNLVIVTRTASGKSLCYNLPVIESIMADGSVRALYIFPTKALVRNQAARLEKYSYAFYYDDFYVGIYDGDTPTEERAKIRKKASIVITTPDMLHLGILPNHDKWQNLFQNLTYVVIDEIHMYSGIFGANMAGVIRRLRRICRKYNSNPVFICSSATIANPLSFAGTLTGLDFELIDKNGSPEGKKTFLFWDTSLKREEGLYRSINTEASLLFYHLISSNIRTIVFTRTRVAAEIILKTTRDLLSGSHNSLIDRITSYRAGYMPELRRKIEKQLATGELLGITTTSALEVGVDTGSLDACIIVGFPRNIMSVWQQAGRVGRRNEDSVVIVIASQSFRDHYYSNQGERFFSSGYESPVIDPDNPFILDGHLKCAAYEFPFEESDEKYFGKSMYPFLRAYHEKNYLYYKDDRFYWNIENYYPAEDMRLRSFSGDFYEIVNYSPPYKVLGVTNTKNIKFYFHRNAVYIHQGETCRVLETDEKKKKIYVAFEDIHHFTRPQIISEIEVKESMEKSFVLKKLYLAKFRIREKCTSYREIDISTGRYIKTVPLTMEEEEMETVGIWFTLSEEIQKALRNYGFELSGGIHGLGHILTSITSIYTLCESHEIGNINTAVHKSTGEPTVFLYDRLPGGAGYCKKAFEAFPDLVEDAYEIITKCTCEKGCPGCIYHPSSAYMEKYLDKKATLFILEKLIEEFRRDFIF